MNAANAVKESNGTDSFLDMFVKDVIEKYPETGKILDDFGVGCVTCAEGACLLKDIVKYHHLPEDRRVELMARLERAVYPDRHIKRGGVGEWGSAEVKNEKSSEVKRDRAAPTRKYSPPIKKLVDEHVLIKRFLALIPAVIERIDLESEADRRFILEGVDFIRSYADRYHHAKEEDILFKMFDESERVIRVMLDNHETGRAHVRGMVEAVERRDGAMLAEHLDGYRALLEEHIKKEDEILYPWMDGDFSVTQVGELYDRFARVDEKTGGGVTEMYEKFIAEAEKTYQGKKV